MKPKSLGKLDRAIAEVERDIEASDLTQTQLALTLADLELSLIELVRVRHLSATAARS